MAKTLEALHAELESLRRDFELYFMGHEKRMPSRRRDRLKRDLHAFEPGNDSVQRFKHKNLVQRWMVSERYWQRILKAIEEGRYVRDVQKARLRHSWKKDEGPGASSNPEGEANARERAREVGNEAEAFMASLAGGPRTPLPSVPMRGAPKAAGPAVPMRGRSKADAPAVPLRGRPMGGSSPPRPVAPPARSNPSSPPRPAPPARQARASAPPNPAPSSRQTRASAPARPAPPVPRRAPSVPPPRGAPAPSPGMRGRPVADADGPPLRVPLRGRAKDRDDSP